MSPQIAWVALVTAGLLDVGWAISMKYAEGYTHFGWSVVSLALLAVFVFLLGRALQVLEIGVAYTVWTGIGVVGHADNGRFAFRRDVEPREDRRNRHGDARHCRLEACPDVMKRTLAGRMSR
jgi:quaternary ammonium compound-resistance protein SugE